MITRTGKSRFEIQFFGSIYAHNTDRNLKVKHNLRFFQISLKIFRIRIFKQYHTSSDSIILQHWPTLVIFCSGFDRIVSHVDGIDQEEQYPLHAFNVTENSTQSGILIFLVSPETKLIKLYTLIIRTLIDTYWQNYELYEKHKTKGGTIKSEKF